MPLLAGRQSGEDLTTDGVFIRLQKPEATRGPPDEWTTEVAKLYRMSRVGKTDSRAWRGVFCLFLDRTGGNDILRRCRPLIRLVFFPVATHVDGHRGDDNDALNNILYIGIDADKGKTAFDQTKDHRANQGAGNAPHPAH